MLLANIFMEGIIINRIKELRNIKKLTQTDISSFLNISVSYYSELENNKKNLPTDLLQKLSDFYGVSTDYILGRDNIPPPKSDELPKDLKILINDEKKLKPEQIKLIHNIVKEFLERHKNDKEE